MVKEKGSKGKNLARIYLGALLGLMALGQILSFDSFANIIGTYQLPQIFDNIFITLVIIFLEIIAAVGLLWSKSPKKLTRIAALCGLIVTLLWAFLAVQAFMRGLSLDNCGCFGSYLGQPLRWWILIEDALFVTLAAYVAKKLTAQ